MKEKKIKLSSEAKKRLVALASELNIPKAKIGETLGKEVKREYLTPYLVETFPDDYARQLVAMDIVKANHISEIDRGEKIWSVMLLNIGRPQKSKKGGRFMNAYGIGTRKGLDDFVAVKIAIKGDDNISTFVGIEEGETFETRFGESEIKGNSTTLFRIGDNHPIEEAQSQITIEEAGEFVGKKLTNISISQATEWSDANEMIALNAQVIRVNEWDEGGCTYRLFDDSISREFVKENGSFIASHDKSPTMGSASIGVFVGQLYQPKDQISQEPSGYPRMRVGMIFPIRTVPYRPLIKPKEEAQVTEEVIEESGDALVTSLDDL